MGRWQHNSGKPKCDDIKLNDTLQQHNEQVSSCMRSDVRSSRKRGEPQSNGLLV